MNTTANGIKKPERKAIKPIDIFGFIKRYAFSIVVCALFIFTMVAPLALLAERPTYTVAGKLMITPVTPSLITKSEDPSIINFFHDYARTQVERMRDDSVVEAAISKMTEEEQAAFFPPFIDDVGRMNMLRGRVRITPVSRTHLIQLILEGDKQSGLAGALNSVMDAYIDKLKEEDESKYLSRLEFLREKRNDIEHEVIALEKKINQVTQEIHSSAFVEDYNMVQKQVEQLQKIYLQQMAIRIEKESNYNQALKKGKALAEISLDPMIDEVVLNDQSLDFTTSWTYQKLQELRASIDGITKNNKDRQYVEQRMAAMKEYEAKLGEEIRDNAERILTGKRDYEIEREILDSRAQYQAAKDSEDQIRNQLEETRVQADEVSLGILKGSSLEKDLYNKRDTLFRLSTRILELESESKAPQRVTIESRARFPESPSGTNLKKLLMACMVLAFALPSGIFVLIELLDNRIHRPKDIEFAVGSKPLWPISMAPEGVDFLKILSEAPDHRSSKAIRSLAVNLLGEHEQHQAKVFLFTGVSRNVGSCSIMLNTAHAMKKQVSRILLIDGDHTGSNLSRMLDLPVDHPHGLENFLTGRDSLENCLLKDKERGLDIITFGKPVSGSEAASRKFIHMVHEQRDMYDVIFVYTDPILSSDLTELLCGVADAAVLVSKGDKTLYNELYRAASLFFRFKIKALAPVLNWGGKKEKDMVTTLIETSLRYLTPLMARKRKQKTTRGNTE
ncbi:GumC family protein [Desulfogranum japonicum]|uniref:GumC family protein n=1 Tax=Desulfogranum japonicum TaxID=231447 RepID=UPI0004191749|nr:hypothetical protein [Desulfogranum japonicum]